MPLVMIKSKLKALKPLEEIAHKYKLPLMRLTPLTEILELEIPEGVDVNLVLSDINRKLRAEGLI